MNSDRNRLKAIGNPDQATSEARLALGKNRAGADPALDVWSRQLAIDEADLQRLHAEAEKTWNALIAEGSKRVDDLVPPGYLDAEKGDQYPEGAAGDFLVYTQACHEAKTRQMDLIIVTNDEKEDWWWPSTSW
ncbi:PIN-like domain-containing protein [Actinoplanes sp. NPDC000266]